MYFIMFFAVNSITWGVRKGVVWTSRASRMSGIMHHASPLLIVVVALTTLHKGGGTAIKGPFSFCYPRPSRPSDRRIHRRSIVMYSLYSLLLLFLFFITKIAAAEALIHGRYPRFNHVGNPNVSVLARISPGVQNLTGT